jgi:hypothetical protein
MVQCIKQTNHHSALSLPIWDIPSAFSLLTAKIGASIFKNFPTLHKKVSWHWTVLILVGFALFSLPQVKADIFDYLIDSDYRKLHLMSACAKKIDETRLCTNLEVKQMNLKDCCRLDPEVFKKDTVICRPNNSPDPANSKNFCRFPSSESLPFDFLDPVQFVLDWMAPWVND